MRNLTRPITAQVKFCEDTGGWNSARLLRDPFIVSLPHSLMLSQLQILKNASFIHHLPIQPGSLSDSLLLWLSEELSEEETALLALSLRLCRSTAQLVTTRAGSGGLSSRAFTILAMWRRGLPAVPNQPKASLLARYLAKIGRPDLARELLLRQAGATRQESQN